MPQNRSERPTPPGGGLPVQMEVLRRAAESSRQQDPSKDENKIPLFWRVFGGTVLSIIALVVMTGYQSLAGNVGDIGRSADHLEADTRKEMSRLAELHGELVRRDEFDTQVRGLQAQLDEIHADDKLIADVKQRCDGLLAEDRQAARQRGAIRDEAQGVRERAAAARRSAELREELARLRDRLGPLESQAPALRPVMSPAGD